MLLDNLSVQIHGELPVINVPVEAKVVRMDIRDIAKRYELIEGQTRCSSGSRDGHGPIHVSDVALHTGELRRYVSTAGGDCQMHAPTQADYSGV